MLININLQKYKINIKEKDNMTKIEIKEGCTLKDWNEVINKYSFIDNKNIMIIHSLIKNDNNSINSKLKNQKIYIINANSDEQYIVSKEKIKTIISKIQTIDSMICELRLEINNISSSYIVHKKIYDIKYNIIEHEKYIKNSLNSKENDMPEINAYCTVKQLLDSISEVNDMEKILNLKMVYEGFNKKSKC